MPLIDVYRVGKAIINDCVCDNNWALNAHFMYTHAPCVYAYLYEGDRQWPNSMQITN